MYRVYVYGGGLCKPVTPFISRAKACEFCHEHNWKWKDSDFIDGTLIIYDF